MSGYYLLSNLKNPFKEWLQIIGFSKKSIKNFSVYISEMLVYFDNQELTSLEEVTAEKIHTFFFHWKQRKNKRTGAGLSVAHSNAFITSIHAFIKYLKYNHNHSIALVLERDKLPVKIPKVVSQQEIKALYQASYFNIQKTHLVAYGQRDRAMLAVFYGCGLRLNEGRNLLLKDVMIDKKLVLVRKGKGNKERFVPIADKGLQDIQEYINYGRKYFLATRHKKQKVTTPHFFIAMDGLPMQSFGARLAKLKKEAGITTDFSLHSLRHSIATHLLEQGMDIEQIKKFLGHSSLDSTQLYTHILNAIA